MCILGVNYSPHRTVGGPRQEHAGVEGIPVKARQLRPPESRLQHGFRLDNNSIPTVAFASHGLADALHASPRSLRDGLGTRTDIDPESDGKYVARRR